MNLRSKSNYMLLLLAIFILITSNVSAQTITSGSGTGISRGEDCRVRYSYDAAGNRIKREYKCITYDPYGTATTNTGVLNVYPNPTTGVFHAEFSEPVDEAYFMITASDGRVVQTYELMQQAQLVTFDITAQVPGSYFLTVWALNQEETHTIMKSQ